MAKQTGFLTIYSADRSEIYGEFADATWDTEGEGDELNHVFSGTASEGTVQTFRRIDSEAIDHVAFDFETDGVRYKGDAQLLALSDTRQPGEAVVRIETGAEPKAAT